MGNDIRAGNGLYFLIGKGISNTFVFKMLINGTVDDINVQIFAL